MIGKTTFRHAMVMGISALSSLWPTPNKAEYVLAPIQLGGELSYLIRQNSTEDRDDSENQLVRFRLNANSFIWQPWMALWDAGITLGLSDNQSDNNPDTTSKLTGGNLRLRLFPRSHFPLEMFYNQSDSRLEDDDSFLSDITTSRYGISQRYTNRVGTQYHFRLERLIADDDNGSDKGSLLRLGASHSFERHQLGIDSTWSKINRDQENTLQRFPEEDTRDLSAVLRHRYRPRHSFSISSTLDYNDEETVPVDDIEIGFVRTQFNSFLTWQPETKRSTRVTSNMRILDFQRDGTTVDSQTLSSSLTLGATYDWTDHIQLNSSLGLSRSEANNAETTDQSFESVGVRYRSSIIPLGPYDYSWSIGTNFINRNNSDGNSQDIDVGLGHSLIRSHRFDNGSNISLRLRQNTSANEERNDNPLVEEDSERRLTHGAGINWNHIIGGTSVFAGVSLSDSRDLGVDDETFQLLTFQASGSRRFGRFATLSGNLTHQITHFDEQEGVGVDRRDRSTGAGIRFDHGRIFGVRNLRFSSRFTLRDSIRQADDDDLEALLLDERRADREWENRFDYRIGKLDLSLIGRIAERDDDQQEAILARITRRFGR